MITRKAFNVIAATLLLGTAIGVQAQPDQPVKFLVGFPPGGSTDTIARLLADKMSIVLKQTVIVENRPGAGGRIAAQALKTAPADGLTYMIAPNATPVFQTLLYPPAVLKYDMLNDFTPVGMIASSPLALAVNSQSGMKTAKDYVNWVKANAKNGSFGSAGAGGHTHFTGVQLGKAIGVDLQVVPYRGNGPLVSDLLGNQVSAGIMTAGDILPQQKAGKVNLLGVFGSKRSPLLPDVPTMMEQGINVDAGDAWTGMWAPAKTPKAALERVQNALKYALELPDVRATMIGKATLNPDFRSPAEMDQIQRKELAYWGPVIKATGFTPDQ